MLQACTYSLGVGTCYKQSLVGNVLTLTSTVAAGYYCPDIGSKQCKKCQSGYYGSDGSTCKECVRGTTSVSGSIDAQSCKLQLNLLNNGSDIVYVPFDVEKVHVIMWGGGGGGNSCKATQWFPSSGGGGGYSSCNITVKQGSLLYVLVGGGGETNDNVPNMNLGGSLSHTFSQLIFAKFSCS